MTSVSQLAQAEEVSPVEANVVRAQVTFRRWLAKTDPTRSPSMEWSQLTEPQKAAWIHAVEPLR